MGDMNGVTELDDPKRCIVDLMATSLGLERVGWMFTKIDQETILTGSELRKAAAYQNEHQFDHPLGFKCSKFVTVVVQPNAEGDVGINCYQVSDQGQALERDNVFGDHENRKLMAVRVPDENDMVPAIMRQGTTVKEFEPEFFIITMSHGQPAEHTDYRILKIYDFPATNRGTPATKQEYKGYLNKYKGE